MINKIKISKNFFLDEFQCKGKNCCGNLVKIYPEMIKLLQKCRSGIGMPIIINSGYRCPIHNKAVGGKEHSYHLLGLAADITCKIGVVELGRVAFEAGFQTVLVYRHQNFVHVDIRYRKEVKYWAEKK